jgi:antitoxin component YwqK of YwqJK toxin-antitoxin module
MTEIVSNSERLKNFQNVDFLTPQPYQKVVRVYSRDPSGSIPAFSTSYHPNGQVKQYLEIVNNRAHGVYREWYANGNLKVDAYLIEGVPDLTFPVENSWLFDGVCRAYDEEGHLAAEIPYQQGAIQGVALHYHPNGKMWKEIPYKNNALCGEMRIFLDNGELLQSTPFINDLKDGQSLRYWSPGCLASEEFYEKGCLHNAVYRSPSGEVIAEICDGHGYQALFSKEGLSELHEVRYGFPEGEVKVFDPKGRIVKIYHVKKGLKHGEELVYFFTHPSRPPQPKVCIPWYEGRIQGIAKTWYDSGALESQRELSDNKRNGVALAWYRDGQLMLIEEYEHDKLKKGEYFRKGDRHPVTQVVDGEGIVTFFDSEGNFVRKASYRLGKPNEQT